MEQEEQDRGSVGALPEVEATPDVLRRFASADPRDILSWLSQGDPLALETRCALRLRTRRFLVDPETCAARAAAQVALRAREFRTERVLEEWLAARIDEAIDALRERDRRELEAGLVPIEPVESRFSYLRDALGIEASTTLAAAVAFNDLPFEERDGFFALCIECRSVRECLDAGMGPPELLRERTNRALDTIAGKAWGESE